MSKQELEHLKQIIDKLHLKELSGNNVYISAVIHKQDLDLLQKIFSLQL
jgi:hypothetical protein